MKIGKNFIVVNFLICTLIAFTAGCEYDVAQPPYNENKDKPLPPSPAILQITPAAATAGVNTITIEGTGFAGSRAIDHVYFDNVEVDTANIVSISTTAITVRRPNIVTDTCTIKVNSYVGGAPVAFKPYRIDGVVDRYGSYIENVILGGIDVDNTETIYVVGGLAPFPVTKATPGSGKTILLDTLPNMPTAPPANAPTDMKVGPGGYLYILRSHRMIQRVNMATGEPSIWHNLKDSRQLRAGDFDTNGNFYAGGGRTDLYVIHPDSTSTASGMYATGSSGDSIYAIHVYGNFVYVAAGTSLGTSSPVRAIFRHTIDAGGNLGAREMIVDLSITEFSSRLIRDFALSNSGTLYIAAGSTNPLLIANPATNQVDYFYKSIVPPYWVRFGWGAGNYIYIISGSSSPAQEWSVYRINMGTTGAAK